MHTHHLPALGYLLLMVVTAITLGGTAKTKFVKRTSIALAILASAIFVTDFYYAVMMAFDHKGFWAITVLLCFVDFVFFLGAMIVCNQDMGFENGGVTIKKDGLLYRMIYNEGMGMGRRRDDFTLCSISWLGALVIVLYPIILIVGHLVMAIVALAMFLIAAQNPLHLNRWWQAWFAENWNGEEAWETLYLGPMPFSPFLIILILCLVGMGVYSLIHMPWISWWLALQLGIAFVLLMVVLLPIAYVAALLVDRAEIASTGKPLPDGEQRTEKVLVAPRAIGELAVTPFVWLAMAIKTILDPIAAILPVWKKRACPAFKVRA
ncbi:MAG: hypothetical protein HW405_513 [Candidatus Berkelbacteria bacterium]|nr:hypothetical protein [Candidatus Berkelbacteria bacterium]